MEPILGKADLHIHSKYSPDAFPSIRDILKRADEINLDVIAVTDHNTTKGSEEALRLADEFKVKVVKGEEVTTKQGHLLAVFIDQFVFPKRPILDTIKEIHKQGGLAIIPHPLNPTSQGVSLKTLFQIYKEADGIELFNASLTGWINRERVKKLNSEIFNLAPLGGSDVHVLSQMGTGYTIFKGKTSSDLFFSIKNKLTQPASSFSFLSHLELFLNQPRRIIKKSLMKYEEIRNSRSQS